MPRFFAVKHMSGVTEAWINGPSATPADQRCGELFPSTGAVKSNCTRVPWIWLSGIRRNGTAVSSTTSWIARL
jgi:hypothetical protein